MAGCAEDPLGYVYVDNYNLSILQGGDAGVYFLPPLLQSTYDGTFAGDREPVVVICSGAPATPCAAPVTVLDGVLDEGEDDSEVVRVDVAGERYAVNWKTNALEQGLYRIFVTEAGAPQAFIDAVLSRGGTSVTSSRRIRPYGTQEPREFTGTLLIAFRMEEVAAPAGGLFAQYYDWRNTTPDYATAPLILERLDPVVDFADPTGSADVFGIGQSVNILARWTGFFVPETTAFHTVCVTFGAGGARVYINNFLFISAWAGNTDGMGCASLAPQAGTPLPIRIEWHHATGATAAQLYWQTPAHETMVIIPSSALLPS
jgi:hypothetical protein